MSYRNVYIKKAKKLSYKYCSLIITKLDDEEIAIPLEDIASILVEDQTTIITSYLLSKISEYYISMIICNEKYLPVSLVTPINMHHKQLGVFQKQISVRKPLVSQIWTKTVTKKMVNQLNIIKKFFPELDIEHEYLLKLIKDVKSNDKTNREAIVASKYFKLLFGTTFIRRKNEADAVNMALNYGYAILAAHMTRVLIMYGFNTNIGIHHCSQTNSLNLSYDLVEPFRVIVDRYVYQNIDQLSYPLSSDTRQELIKLLEETIILDGKKYSVQNAMESMVLSIIKCYDKNSSDYLLLPEVFDYES